MMSNDVLDRNEGFLDHKNVILTYMYSVVEKFTFLYIG